MPINQLFGLSDNMGNDYSQWETNDAVVYQTIRFSATEAVQGGRLTVNYNAINLSNGNAADRVKMARWKIINGVATVAVKGNIFSNNDTGMNNVDVDVIAQGGEIIITLTGLANTTIRHTLQITKLSSALNQ
ncbi:MAG: hypothetical protein ACTHKV_00895 [Flavipsychrobacter sp.]